MAGRDAEGRSADVYAQVLLVLYKVSEHLFAALFAAREQEDYRLS